ncbi:MAG: hypothetical protein AAF490_00915 [Chloroflexota bacterium]
MSETSHQTEHAGSPQHNADEHAGPFSKTFDRLWKLVPENLQDTFMPEDVELRKIPGEETQLEIRLAWYRDIIGHVLFHNFILLTIIMILLMISIGVLANFYGFAYYFVAIPLIIYIALIILALVERLEYSQWRLLKTNSRLVISIPQHGAWPLVDNIELKGTPAIIDTNWSPKPHWRVFQFFTGARDLYISMSGLQFVEGKAKVRDALIIPDIMPSDVFELKKLVFKPK